MPNGLHRDNHVSVGVTGTRRSAFGQHWHPSVLVQVASVSQRVLVDRHGRPGISQSALSGRYGRPVVSQRPLSDRRERPVVV